MLSSGATMKLTFLGYSEMSWQQLETKTFGTDVHGPQRMNPDDFGDTLTFHLAAPGKFFLI